MQPAVVRHVCAQIAAGTHHICGIATESFFVEDRQAYDGGTPLVYGQSITDACMSWDTTATLLQDSLQPLRNDARLTASNSEASENFGVCEGIL